MAALFLRAFTLTCFFFYPLTASIEESAYFLHWTPTNSLELLVAMLIMSIIYFVVFKTQLTKPLGRVRFLILTFIIAPPLAFFAIHFLRQVFSDETVETIASSLLTKMIIVLVPLALVYPLVIKKENLFRERAQKVLNFLLTMAFPLSLIALWVVIKTFLPQEDYKKMEVKAAQQSVQENTLILLFDEMSYQFLYKDKNINKLFPNFEKFSQEANNYHMAFSFGKQTLTAIPPMLLGKDFEDKPLKPIAGKLAFEFPKGWKLYDGLHEDIFYRAKTHGLTTHVVGKYHPYCDIFKNLDSCDSCSTYNTSGVTKRFNVLHAFLTNFNILPSKMPFGLFKNPVASRNHKNTFFKELKLTRKIISQKEPFFAFIHFNSPHAPFVFNRQGYRPVMNPYNQNEANYMEQMEYVDYTLGKILNKLKRLNKYENTNVVIMSDHNYRKMTPENEHNRIPLMIKKVGQKQRFDFDDKITSGDLVNCLLPNDKNCSRDINVKSR